jgi:nicotinamide N-methyltransferase
VVTDYEDETILGNLRRNVDRNRALAISPVVCLGYSWGNDVGPLLYVPMPTGNRRQVPIFLFSDMTPSRGGFEAMILSDLLHFNDAHITLVRCVVSLLAKKPESRAYIAAGKYTRDSVCDSFFQLCNAEGFDVTEAVDVDDSGGIWLGTMPVSGLDQEQLGIRKKMCRFWVLRWKDG